MEWLMSQSWSLLALKGLVYLDLCNQLDVVTAMGNGYVTLAGELGYTPHQIALFERRCHGNSVLPNSPTHALLQDYGLRGGTIQGIQSVLQGMQHIAASIIPDNIARVYEAVWDYYEQQRVNSQSTSARYSGFQDTEPSNCGCQNCCPADYSNPVGLHQSRQQQQQQQQQQRPLIRMPSNQIRNQNGSRSVADASNVEAESGNSVPGPAINGSVSGIRNTIAQNLIQSNGSVTHAQIRSELQDSRTALRRNICEYCRTRVDTDETVRLTTSIEKTQQCECVDLTDRDDSVALLSRLAPVGRTDTDTCSVAPDISGVATSHDGTVSRSSNQPIRCSTHQQTTFGRQPDSPTADLSATSAELGRRLINNANPNTVSKSERNYCSDSDRHSWPSNCHVDEENALRNSTSDSLLDCPNGNNPRDLRHSDRGAIADTLYVRLASSSCSSDYRNNFDREEIGEDGNLDNKNGNLSLNVAASNSMNEPSGAQAILSNSLSPSNNRFSCQSSDSVDTRVKVFATYAWNQLNDLPGFLEDVMKCCKELRQAGAQVRIDMDDGAYARLRLNKFDWIDKNIREAKYILVCISPTYILDTQEPVVDGGAPRITQLNARYIFDKLRQEYFFSNSVNRRVIPVMFHEYGTTLVHVPGCMRTTVVHSYPNETNSVLKAVFGRARYRPD